MGVHLITGHAGEAHIETSDDQSSFVSYFGHFSGRLCVNTSTEENIVDTEARTADITAVFNTKSGPINIREGFSISPGDLEDEAITFTIHKGALYFGDYIVIVDSDTSVSYSGDLSSGIKLYFGWTGSTFDTSTDEINVQLYVVTITDTSTSSQVTVRSIYKAACMPPLSTTTSYFTNDSFSFGSVSNNLMRLGPYIEYDTKDTYSGGVEDFLDNILKIYDPDTNEISDIPASTKNVMNGGILCDVKINECYNLGLWNNIAYNLRPNARLAIDTGSGNIPTPPTGTYYAAVFDIDTWPGACWGADNYLTSEDYIEIPVDGIMLAANTDWTPRISGGSVHISSIRLNLKHASIGSDGQIDGAKLCFLFGKSQTYKDTYNDLWDHDIQSLTAYYSPYYTMPIVDYWRVANTTFPADSEV